MVDLQGLARGHVIRIHAGMGQGSAQPALLTLVRAVHGKCVAKRRRGRLKRYGIHPAERHSGYGGEPRTHNPVIMLSITRADQRPCTRSVTKLGALPVRAGALGGGPMLYSSQVQQQARIPAHYGEPLRTNERLLTWACAGVRVSLPVSGVKGSRVQIPPSRLVKQVFRFKFREPIGGANGFPGAGADQLGGVRLQDAVHGGGVIGEGGPDLVTIDRLGDRRAAVPDQVADVLHPDIVGAQDGHERVPQFAAAADAAAG